MSISGYGSQTENLLYQIQNYCGTQCIPFRSMIEFAKQAKPESNAHDLLEYLKTAIREIYQISTDVEEGAEDLSVSDYCQLLDSRAAQIRNRPIKALYLNESLEFRSVSSDNGDLVEGAHSDSLKINQSEGLFLLSPQIGTIRVNSLFLNYSKLKRLPREIGQLSSLRSLDLSHNHLKELPKEIRQLSLLETLDVSHNRLRKLPEGIGRLSSLREFNMSDNRIRKLPKGIGRLSSLRKFNVSVNKLRRLPVEIRELTSLEVLDASGNELGGLPKKAIATLIKSRLKTLRVQDNWQGEDNSKRLWKEEPIELELKFPGIIDL